jgi:hypothetical protein
VRFEPVAAGSAPRLGLSPDAMTVLRDLAASASSRRVPPSKGVPALGGLAVGSIPLLPDWTWPMAEPDDPTPIYEQLIKNTPDPRGTEPSATDPTTPTRTDDQDRPEVAAHDEHGRGRTV